MAKYIGYIYKTTNLINGKIYIGQHQSDLIDIDYFGSGRKIKKAIKRYGKNSFILEVLCWKKTIKSLNMSEIYFIKAFDSINPKVGYNISNEGQIGWMKGVKQTEEAKRLIGLAATGNKYCLGNPSWNKGKTGIYSKETLRKISEAGKGRKASKESIEKNRLFHIGIRHTEETRTKSIGNKGKQSVPMSEAAKKKLSVYWTGKPWTENRRAAYERSKLKLEKVS
jgi:group I intron endonuclease